MIDTDSLQYFLAGWGVILGTIWLMAKFEGTKTLLYYLFWLGIVLDLVTHGTQIAAFVSVIFPNLYNPSQATINEQYGPNPLGGLTLEQQPGGNTNQIKTFPGANQIISQSDNTGTAILRSPNLTSNINEVLLF